MYKKIVVAVDGSDISRNAVKHAVDLANASGGTLTAVYVIPVLNLPEIESFKPGMIIDGLAKEGERILSDVKNVASGEDVKVETRIENGTPYEKICDVADEAGADLIIMGTHGRTGVGKVFVGSVTERVIGNAHCPVLAVR